MPNVTRRSFHVVELGPTRIARRPPRPKRISRRRGRIFAARHIGAPAPIGSHAVARVLRRGTSREMEWGKQSRRDGSKRLGAILPIICPRAPVSDRFHARRMLFGNGPGRAIVAGALRRHRGPTCETPQVQRMSTHVLGLEQPLKRALDRQAGTGASHIGDAIRPERRGRARSRTSAREGDRRTRCCKNGES